MRICSRIFPEVQNEPVLKEVSPLRIYALERNVVLEPFATAFKDGTKELRQRKDRRALVEGEAFGLQAD